MRAEQESYQLTIAEDQSKGNAYNNNIKKVRHVYLQQENIYGRFIPYLLLKEQLLSQVDSSGNTALHHMCSHNSAYIPLFLSTISNNDPILNRKSKLGHTPLDVAGLYCSKDHIDLLKAKGAVDNGNVDYWAIQGANPSNWSGKIYPQKKSLIHWAAYNDMPQVITEYAKEGVNISQPDSNGYTPIDLTILNKSYNCMKVLAELGERPKLELLKTCDSISIRQYFQKLAQNKKLKAVKQILKPFSLVIILLLCLVIHYSDVTIGLVTINLFLMIHIIIKSHKAERYMDNNRKTEFVSELCMGKAINRHNHKAYLLLHVFTVICGSYSLLKTHCTNHLQALATLIVIASTVAYTVHLFTQIYSIANNLTYDELFYSHRWAHLWEKIKFVQQRKLLIRQFSNGEDKGIWHNLKDYFCQ